jgi:hypothetical protein
MNVSDHQRTRKEVSAMPATKAEAPATPEVRRHARRNGHARRVRVDRTAALSDDVLAEIEQGQRDAIKAVRAFVETVDKALPPHDHEPTRRGEIVDSAMQMADSLVRTQYEFVRKVVRSAGKTLGTQGAAK